MSLILNNRLLNDGLDKGRHFSNFQCGFSCFCSFADLPTVVFVAHQGFWQGLAPQSSLYRVRIKHITIAKCNIFFHHSDAKEISFYYFCNKLFFAEFCHKLKSYGISGGVFGLILSFLSHGGQRVVWEENSLLKYPYNVGVPQESMLGTMLSHYTLIATFVMMLSIILLSLQMIGLFTLMVIRLLICVNN